MPKRFNCLLAVLTMLLVAASAVFAHHSVAGQFDTSKSLTLKGSIAKLQWMNPHIYVYIDVKEADGTVTTWALETLPTAMMRSRSSPGLARSASAAASSSPSSRPGRRPAASARPAPARSSWRAASSSPVTRNSTAFGE